MKKTYYLQLIICLVAIFSACTNTQRLTVGITNPSDFDRTEELVEIPLKKIKGKVKLKDNQAYVIRNAQGEIVPVQKTYDDKLIFQSGLKAKQTDRFTIVAEDATIEYVRKVTGRCYTERYDDFAWENDRIGFRAYSAALMKIQAPISGLDLFYKRTNNIVLDKWYEADLARTASYHVDHGEGCDPYAVGRTLGAGSMTPYVNELIYLNNNYTHHEIYENGPLRLTFKLTYPDMTVDGQTLTDSKVISLDAGSQLTKITQTYSTTVPITVATGFPKRAKETQTLFEKGTDFFLYEEPYNEKNEQIFLGLVMPQGIQDVVTTNKTFDINTNAEEEKPLQNVITTNVYEPGKPITYYTGFGWTKFGFKNIEEFYIYLKNYSAGLKQPLEINY